MKHTTKMPTTTGVQTCMAYIGIPPVAPGEMALYNAAS
jgi:hypothetical protein